MNKEQEERYRMAANRADWLQVILNSGPPCFHIEDDGDFCLRAQRWDGHDPKDSAHAFVSFSGLISLLGQNDQRHHKLRAWLMDYDMSFISSSIEEFERQVDALPEPERDA